ncbi:BgTH12-07124 [Blumeria graminis f. sp. triticale]|uniref:Bgt-840 n=3 Tax=Blumeria graminis TaxID=34373 RepID=A0A9X9MP50_BLUGR|nr:hypothetical protein BGT96224_840 [Blumeria graminis f. sp. tritici 96224]CAD6506197.1 BgTH12-07124 [Blumeria graminis f. sp. triticale]VDB94918.1 Bgt-840 [Blumeria graminis f. sp. tritici]
MQKIARSHSLICHMRSRILSRSSPWSIAHTFTTLPRVSTQRLVICSRQRAFAIRQRSTDATENATSPLLHLDLLGNVPIPSTAVDACLWDGFHLNSGAKITGGSGVLLVAGEAFCWKPWKAREDGALRLCNPRGQWEVTDEAWGVLELVWPKPDLLILGLGPNMRPLSPQTKARISRLGIRLEIQDTRNAAAQFNLLAAERGLSNVAAALIPLGWREEVGVL